MATKIPCHEITDKVLTAYLHGNDAGLTPLNRWDIATHFRECAGCASRLTVQGEAETGNNPWVGADPVGLVAHRKITVTPD